jgi:hypothetical protein
MGYLHAVLPIAYLSYASDICADIVALYPVAIRRQIKDLYSA